MTIDDRDALYRLMSWLSPSFPVGAFSYSHGLEFAVEAQMVRDEETLRAWVNASLAYEFGPVAGSALRASFEATQDRDADRLASVLSEARARVPTREFELETQAQGQAFLATWRAAWTDPSALAWMERTLGMGWMPYPCAVGIAAASAGVPLEPTLTAFFHAVVSNLVSAGLRLIPLGQTAGQRILAQLQAPVLAAAADVLQRAACDVGSAAPLIEWTSMQHETQYTRLFRS